MEILQVAQKNVSYASVIIMRISMKGVGPQRKKEGKGHVKVYFQEENPIEPQAFPGLCSLHSNSQFACTKADMCNSAFIQLLGMFTTLKSAGPSRSFKVAFQS